MSNEIVISASELEDLDEVDVVEILVAPGDHVEVDQAIVTLESDKAMMEFPAAHAGVVKSIAVAVGDKIKQGDTLLILTNEGDDVAGNKDAADNKKANSDVNKTQAKAKKPQKNSTDGSGDIVITASELEDFDEVDVVEILVMPGDEVEVDQAIVTLESDKAMMEFPASHAGVVKTIAVAVGDKVKQGDTLLTLSGSTQNLKAETDRSEKAATDANTKKAQNKDKSKGKAKGKGKEKTKKEANKKSVGTKLVHSDKAYASPAVRKYANELGVNLDEVSGSAKQGRIIKQDVQDHVKSELTPGVQRQANKADYPLPDFSQFGSVEEVSLNKLRQVSARHLHHSWTIAPHVTQFDDADITDLEKARKELKQSVAEQGAKLTLLPFIMKALVKCLQEFPDFNSSLNAEGTALIHKHYYNLGIAVDTPRGLVVPVIKDVENKKIPQLARELMEMSELARDNKLKPKDMQGGCMTITSLGGIGGQHFTPIINQPEVAILGVSRTQQKLVKNNNEIEERLMLPLSLSYDHRAIDGVAAVKFITSLNARLSDVWTLMI